MTLSVVSTGGNTSSSAAHIAAVRARIERRRMKYAPPRKQVSWIANIPSGPATNNSMSRHSCAIIGGCQLLYTPVRDSPSCHTESKLM